MELLASFQYGARSSCYRFQFNMEASYLHTSVQPAEPQTRVKTGRHTFFLPAYGFINPSKMHRIYQSDYSAPPNPIK